MARFSAERKGYNKKEVEDYIGKTEKYLEGKIKDLQERITSLKEELEETCSLNEEYRKRENKISGLLLKAMDVKEELEAEARAERAIESDRLKIFREKWLTYATELRCTRQSDVIAKLDKLTDEVCFDLEQHVRTDLNLLKALPKEELSPETEQEFRDESARVTEAKKEKAELTPEEESRRLANLCKSLGILDD